MLGWPKGGVTFGKAKVWGDPCLGRRKCGVTHVWEGGRVG